MADVPETSPLLFGGGHLFQFLDNNVNYGKLTSMFSEKELREAICSLKKSSVKYEIPGSPTPNPDVRVQQGVSWADLKMDYDQVRGVRESQYQNYVRFMGSDQDGDEKPLPRDKSFFSVEKMYVRPTIIGGKLNDEAARPAHGHHRDGLLCLSTGVALYPAIGGISRMDMETGEVKVVMDVHEGSKKNIGGHRFTLTAGGGFILATTRTGRCFIKSLDCDDAKGYNEFFIGQPITHTSIYSTPQGQHQVLMACNDRSFRTMDLKTQQELSINNIDFDMWGTALDPKKRSRLVVGASNNILVLDVATGAKKHLVPGAHRDHVSACAWSDDGHTIATGSQDRTVKIWDTRFLLDGKGKPNPVHSIGSNMAAIGTLRFSPGGSGPSVLAAAEHADFVNVIDASTYASSQRFTFFSEINGMDFHSDGQGVVVLCGDYDRGGLLQLKRAT